MKYITGFATEQEAIDFAAGLWDRLRPPEARPDTSVKGYLAGWVKHPKKDEWAVRLNDNVRLSNISSIDLKGASLEVVTMKRRKWTDAALEVVKAEAVTKEIIGGGR